ncbi:MAG: hypothetical protein ABUT20_10760 [Bacteroidota bacterium]
MKGTFSSETTKKLVFGLVLENIDYRKKCLYIQEIISLGKVNDVWWRALLILLDKSANSFSLKTFCKN